MKKTWRFSALAMATLLSAGMVACGGGGNGGGGGTGGGGSGVLEISVINKGYGYKWLEEIVDEYKKDTGKQVKLNPATANNSKYLTEISSGPSANSTDLYFTIDAKYFQNIISKGVNAIDGYNGEPFADISDVYSAELADYGDSLKNMMPEYYLDAMTYEGKQYTLPWAQGAEGIIYNTKLFEQYSLKVPNTTDELLALCKQIKTLNNGTYVQADTPDGKKDVYPFYFARENNYSMVAWLTWWTQYEGTASYNSFLEGKDATGNYSYTVFAQKGREEALNVVHDILYAENGYTNPTNVAFQTAQQYFLSGLGFMNFNGDWLEREAKGYDVDGIKFMKTPVVSAIKNKFADMTDRTMTDETLSKIITQIDAGAASSDLCQQATFDQIKTARQLSCVEGDQHVAAIPGYSDNIEGAKDFLKYFLSKKAQNIQMKESYGNVVPFKRDVTDLESYAGLSELAKSKWAIWNTSEYTGRKYNTPMTYKGNLEVFRSEHYPEKIFASQSSDTYMNVSDFIKAELSYYQNQWSTMMQNAGVE